MKNWIINTGSKPASQSRGGSFLNVVCLIFVLELHLVRQPVGRPLEEPKVCGRGVSRGHVRAEDDMVVLLARQYLVGWVVREAHLSMQHREGRAAGLLSYSVKRYLVIISSSSHCMLPAFYNKSKYYSIGSRRLQPLGFTVHIAAVIVTIKPTL